MPIPTSRRKKALILVDIQPNFVKRWKKPLVANLRQLFAQARYDLYVEVTFHAEKKSLWDLQTKWTFPYEESIPEVGELLDGVSEAPVVRVRKETRSAWKGDKDLKRILRRRGIEEVHIVGLDSNDCVFATAQEAFDLGFWTYVIEECTAASEGQGLHKAAMTILRELGLTNHSK